MSWQAKARRQGGAISYGQLRAAGVTPDLIAGMCRSGHLCRRRRGVFIAGAAPATYESALWIAVLSTNGVLGFRTAAHQWDKIDDPGNRIDVIVDVRNGLRGPVGVRVHRVQSAPRSVTTRNGLPITDRRCSALDHLGRLSPGDSIRFADRALQRSWLTRRDIDRRLEN